MTKAREKIKILASDKISPYKGDYIPNNTQINSINNTKYYLLIFYIILAVIFILSSVRY